MLKCNTVFQRLCVLVSVVGAAAALIPFLYILLVSVSDGAAIAAGALFSSQNALSLDSYLGLFRYADLGASFLNSVILSLGGTTLNLLFTVPCAYALSRRETKGRSLIYSILLAAMFFRGELIPTYVWMSKLGLLNSYWAVWLTKLVSIYNILILASFFESLPEEVLNAAKLDGAGPLSILLRIVLPMSRSALICISIFYLASWWNDYYTTMVYIRDPEQYTLPVRIIQMITNVENSCVYSPEDTVYAKLSVYGIRAAGIVLSVLPMVFVIPFLQKHCSLQKEKTREAVSI